MDINDIIVDIEGRRGCYTMTVEYIGLICECGHEELVKFSYYNNEDRELKLREFMRGCVVLACNTCRFRRRMINDAIYSSWI